MVKPLEESISNIFSYDKKHVSRDRSILCGSSVVEFCHRFSARVLPLQRVSLHRRTLSGIEPRRYMCSVSPGWFEMVQIVYWHI